MKRNTILVTLAVFILLVVSSLSVRLYDEGTEKLLSQFRERQLSYATYLATQMQFYFQARARELRALASFWSVKEGPSERQRADIETYALQMGKAHVKAISLLDSNGRITYSTHPENVKVAGGYSSILSWARDMNNAGKVSLTQVPAGSPPLTFILAAPVYRSYPQGREEQFAGVLLFTLDIRDLLVAQLEAKGSMVSLDQIWIVDNDGTLLFDQQHPDMISRNIHRRDASCTSCHVSFGYVERIFHEGEGFADYRLIGRSTKVAAFASMEFEHVSWTVVVNAPYDKIAQSARRNLFGYLSLFGIVFVAVTVGIAFQARSARMKAKAEQEAGRLQGRLEEQQKAEAALETERDKLKRILDSMSDGVYIANEAYDLVYHNPEIERDRGPVKGRKCYQYVYDQPRVCEWCKGREVFEGKKVGWEWRSAKTGKTYDLMETPTTDPHGAPAKLSIIRDVTGRKKAERELRASEERYRMLVETMNDGLGVQDENGRWVYVNERFAEMLGYSRDEMVGQPVVRFLDEVNQRIYEDQMTRRRKKARGSYEMSWLTRDEEPVFTLMSSQPIFDDMGQFKGSFAIVTGINERKRAEEALRRSESQLRHLNMQLLTAQETERKRISRELHDELGQALTVMKLHMGFIRKGLAKDQDGLKEECDKGTSYIEEVIENVRRLSRDLSPTILEDFGLSAAIKGLITTFARRNGIEVTLEALNIDSLVTEDSRTVVYRIVQEALTNIAKHAMAKKVLVEITRVDKILSISVQDDGQGFDILQALSKNPEERGLGLATMKAHAQMLGGTLGLWTEQGSGTRLSLTIPITAEGRKA
jgi:PAS domain S-box-containing protein